MKDEIIPLTKSEKEECKIYPDYVLTYHVIYTNDRIDDTIDLVEKEIGMTIQEFYGLKEPSPVAQW